MATNNATNSPFPLSPAQGGTGIDNAGMTITLDESLTTVGANNLTLTTLGSSNTYNLTTQTSGTWGEKLGKNWIVGGNFDTNPWQRGTTFSVLGLTTPYTADRWYYYMGASAGTLTANQQLDAPTVSQAGIYCQNSLLTTITTARSSLGSTEGYAIAQPIELYYDLPPNLSISFWVKSSLAGTYCVFLNLPDASTPGYLTQYTITNANTWQYVTLSVANVPTGVIATNNQITIYFILAGGSSLISSTINTWYTFSGTINCTSNQVNLFATNGNTFQLALVQVEKGTYSTPFQLRKIKDELVLCQRYFEKSYLQGVNPGTNTVYGSINTSNSLTVAGTFTNYNPYKVTKFAIPTITIYSVAGNTLHATQNDASEISASATRNGMNGMSIFGTNGSLKYGSAYHFTAATT